MKRLFAGLLFVSLSAFSQNDLKQQWSFAEGLFKRGFYEDALQEYKGLLIDSGSQVEKNALLRIIECCEQSKKDPEEYIDRYIKLETDPNLRIVVQLKKAALLITKKEFDKAEELYKKITSAETNYQEHALYEYGRLLLEQGKNNEAVTTFLDLSSKGKAEDKEVRIYAHYALSSLYLGQENYSSAEKHLNTLTNITKDHSLKTQAFILLIQLLATQERDAELITTHKTLATLNPHKENLNQLTIQYVLALIRSKKYDQARGALASIKNPNAEEEAWANYALGICYYQLGLYKQALISFEKSLLNQNFTESPKALAYLIYCHLQVKDMPKALELSKVFDSKHPTSSLRAEIHYKNSLLALEQNNSTLAVKELQTAINVYLPTWENIEIAHKTLAQTFAQNKQYTESAEIWYKLSGLLNNDKKSTASFKAVENYLLAKDYTQAEEVLVRTQVKPELEFKKSSLKIEICLSNKQWDKAHKLILLGLEKHPQKEKTGLLYMLQGRCFYLQNRLNDASQSLEQASKLIKQPSLLAQNLNLLASIYYSQGKKPQSAEVYAKIFRDNLQKELNWNQKQTQDISRLLELEAYLESSLIACELTNQNNTFFFLQRARIFARLEKYLQSQENLNSLELNKLSDQQFCAYSAIEALILLNDQKIDKASLTLGTIKKIDQWLPGDFPLYLYTKAKLHFINKDYDKALKNANRTYILFNDKQFSAKSLFLAVQSAYQLKRQNDAEKLLKELKKRFPTYAKRPNVANFISKNLAK
ncbi:hypothetical protein LNTAR_03474 [Lentisphaera araneosa HTCC2155]|uniref:Uncharacterized protein n=1 Tax=Lentisphaera araneosa HTCC2155 TaxID=313628 RepID=A6DSQ3_9BACT|nr:tetratricopeptide repeat protein [Lentisphaera araneosa]EDM25306.1 hypothetical protein LNTAR_03474 [Lentisphaera araneosa HTCC2155]